MTRCAGFSLFALGLFSGFSVGAFEPTDGQFLAQEDCSATVGIHRPPDATLLRKGSRYKAVGLNRPNGDFLRLRVPGGKPELRWVRLSCGQLETIGMPAQANPAVPFVPLAGRKDSKLLLSLSWQPSFCEGKPEKPECRSQTASRFDADHFSLHGLWPQPQGREYCQVLPQDRATDERRRWEALPRLNLQSTTSERLKQVMPGAASALERHEWIRHGSCFGSDPDTYFRTALSLLEQVNQSSLRNLLASRLGETVTVRELKTAFEANFGKSAGQALGVRCSRDGHRQLISEIRIKLKQPLDDTTQLRDALDLSSPASGNCDAGVVDRVGLE